MMIQSKNEIPDLHRSGCCPDGCKLCCLEPGRFGPGQSIPTSKVERVNRAPVSKEMRSQAPAARRSDDFKWNQRNDLEDHRFPLITVQFDINGAGALYEPQISLDLPERQRDCSRTYEDATSKQIASRSTRWAHRSLSLRLWSGSQL